MPADSSQRWAAGEEALRSAIGFAIKFEPPAPVQSDQRGVGGASPLERRGIGPELAAFTSHITSCQTEDSQTKHRVPLECTYCTPKTCRDSTRRGGASNRSPPIREVLAERLMLTETGKVGGRLRIRSERLTPLDR